MSDIVLVSDVLPGLMGGPMSVPVGYAGPGDFTSGALGWWGLRAYTRASIGSNAINLRRDGDNATSDFVTVAGGGLDLAAIATFLAGGSPSSSNLFATKLYDQTGNGRHATQASNASQPKFVTNVIGSLPALFFVSAAIDELVPISPTAQAQPFSLSAVAMRTSNFATSQNMVASQGDNSGIIFVGANVARASCDGLDIIVTAADNVFHAFNAIIRGASSDFNVDGNSNPGTLATTPINGSAWEIGAFVGSFGLDGYLVESGIWPSAFNAAGIGANEKTYWGF